MNRAGLQSEILAHLALVMIAATGLLAAFFFHAHGTQLDRLAGLLGRALTAEAASPMLLLQPSSGAIWWRVEPETLPGARNPSGIALGEAELALAREAEGAGRALLRSGRPWQAILFAAPLERGHEVAVARLAPAVSPLAVAALVLADCMVFTLLGLYLLRQRVVLPLRRVSEAARCVGHGDLHVRVAAEGEGEVAVLSAAFNEMTEQLESRSAALEKAVVELRQANDQLRTARAGLDRAERLAAVGSLAAGVAHEVGNPMGALLAFQSMALKDEGLTEQGQEYLRKASGQGERVREILRQLLDFSRPPRARRQAVDLARACEQAVGLVRAQRRYEGVHFEIEEHREVPYAQADESILAQILLNLILNAADATSSSEERRVRICFEALSLTLRAGERERVVADQRRGPDGIGCRIEDSGPGVSAKDRERVFDPFFTTKAPGEGTGLGLANAQRLAEELGGRIEIEESRALGGACFVLLLPSAHALQEPPGNR